jgi:DNA-binding NtrC family response regulator
MPTVPTKILIADADVENAEMVADHLSRALAACVTRVTTATEALKRDIAEEFDLVLADLRLPDGDGLGLTRQLQSYRQRPIILMSDQPTLGRAVEAMRLGVKDLLTKPFDLATLATTLRNAVEQHHRDLRKQLRMERLRSTCRQLGQERRELNRRVELVCCDLVGAYGNLAKKVVEMQSDAS